MPFSDHKLDREVEKFLAENPVERYLDIGPGAGKMGLLIRRVNPKAKIIAVEIEKQYLEMFDLKKIYDKIIVDSIENFMVKNPGFVTEIVTIGDCLEHLKKSDGVDLLNYLMYRCKFMVIVFPSKWIQYDLKGFVHEAHYSVWSEADFEEFEHTYQRKEFMNLVLIKGYLADEEARGVVDGKPHKS